MRPRFGGGPAKPSRRVQATLLGAQDRLTIRRMLSLGGSVQVDGDRATITIPSGGFGTFPASLVRSVQEGIADAP